MVQIATTAAGDGPAAPDRPMTGFQIAAIGTCVAISALDGFDVLAIAFTAPAISRAWGLNPTQVGGLFSAGLAGMGIGAFVLSPLGDRFGRRPAILLCLALLTIGMVASAFTRDLTQMAITRVVTGLGIGGVLASINTVVAEYASPRRRSLAIACMALGYPVGATLGGLASVPLIAAFGWPAVFLLGGVLAALLVPVVLWLLPESLQFLLARRPRGALRKVNRVRARLGQAALAALPAPRPAGPEDRGRMSGLFRGRMLLTTLMVLLLNISVMATVYFAVSWTPKILTELGFRDSIGIYAALMMNVAGAIGCLLYGLLANRFGLRNLSAAVFVGMGTALVAFGIVPASTTPLIVSAFVLGFFLNTAITCLYAILPQVFAPAVRSTGTGIGLGGGRIGAVLGPYIAGILMSQGWSRAEYCTALAMPMLLAIVTLFLLPRLTAPVTSA